MIIPISLMTQPRQRDFWLKLSCPKLYSGRLPRWLSGKELVCQHRRGRFDPWVGKIPWRRKWQPIPVFLGWEIPWTKESHRPQSIGLQRVRHDLASKHN